MPENGVVMDIQQMKMFITAAKCLNFTEAAAQLFISQPALSRQIYNMEKNSTCSCSSASRKSVQLTPAGRFLYEKLTELYGEYMEILRLAQIKAEGYSDVFCVGSWTVTTCMSCFRI